MELNKMEQGFFRNILNAELEVPIRATLSWGEEELEVIVVPQLSDRGNFVLRYFDAPDYEVKGQVSFRVSIGSHPRLEEAWINQYPVTVQLHTRSVPFSLTRGRPDPEIRATLLYAGTAYMGALKLDRNQIVLRDSLLKTSEFSIGGFSDFTVAPTRTLAALIGLRNNTKHEQLVEELEDYGLEITPKSPGITLDSEDGWKIGIVKESTAKRNSTSHCGWVRRSDNREYEIDELTGVLNVFNHFLAFCSGTFHIPSVVLGHGMDRGPVWGQIGPFMAPQPSQYNWFGHRIAPQQSIDLQRLFPNFWLHFNDSPEETIAIIECYVDSKKMNDSGLPKDALAKSFTGLSILAEQILKKHNQSPSRSSAKNISNALDCFPDVPYHILDKSQFPKSTQVAQNIAKDRKPPRKVKGPYLLRDVRNYVMHPLEIKTSSLKKQFKKYVDSDFSHYEFLQDLSQFYLEYLFLGYCGFPIAREDYRKPIESAHFTE